MRTRALPFLFALPFLTLTAPESLADSYPSRTIQLIVPFSAGGPADTVARIVADSLADELGRRINVVNRPGAGGELGMAEIARAPADGYTLGVFGYPDNLVLEMTRSTEFGFDDFTYLAAFDSMPMGIFAAPNAPFDDLEGLRAHAETNPGAVVVGEAGGLAKLNAIAFAERLGVSLTTVNFAGGGDTLNAILGSHIDVASTGIMSTEPITAGGGRVIGFTAAERMDLFPDAPTLVEQGVDLVLGVSRVLVAPAGLPEEVMARLTTALDRIGGDDAMIARFRQASLPYRYVSHEDLDLMLREANAFYAQVIQDNLDQFLQ